MNLPPELQQRLIDRFGRVIDLKESPAVLAAIAEEIRLSIGASGSTPAPFGVSWMDSWVAHWFYEQNLKSATAKNRELAAALRALVDIRFAERLAELQLFIRKHPGVIGTSPDAGPPEPGTPPAGPSSFGSDPFAEPEPPDGGPPEPGVPNPPPEPGPDPGPDGGLFGENPWILYWFVSLKAQSLLNVIDAHFNRRLDELAARVKGSSSP